MRQLGFLVLNGGERRQTIVGPEAEIILLQIKSTFCIHLNAELTLNALRVISIFQAFIQDFVRMGFRFSYYVYSFFTQFLHIFTFVFYCNVSGRMVLLFLINLI